LDVEAPIALKTILIIAIASTASLAGAEQSIDLGVFSTVTGGSMVAQTSVAVAADTARRKKRPKRPPVPDPDHGPTLPPDPWTPI
jgi:hypothetical protein